jgi:uncharacterized membrane protein (DUF485 family)
VKTIKQKIVKLSFLLVLLIILSASFLVKMPVSNSQIPISVQLPQFNALTITITPQIPITPSSTATLEPDKIQYNTNYLLSRTIVNIFNSSCKIEAPLGAIKGVLPLNQISNVSMYDNLGNIYNPMVDNGSIISPELNVTIPPDSIYSLDMSFDSNSGIFYDYASPSYVFNPTFTLGGQISTVTIKLPATFSILDFQSDGTENRDNQSVTITWNIPTGGNINPQVRFIPFSNEPTLEYLSWDLGLTSIQRNNFVQATMKEVVRTDAEYGEWKISPIFPLLIIFPLNSSSVFVEDVQDATGQCSEQYTPTDIVENSSVGHYYLSNTQPALIVYPHAENYGSYYEYEAEVTFRFNSNATSNAGLKMPYTEEASFVTNVNPGDNWQINFTQRPEIEFTLPLNTVITSHQGSQPSCGTTDDGRPQVSFSVNPGSVFGQNFSVTFDVIPERNLFWTSIFIIIYLLFLLVISFKTKLLKRPYFKELETITAPASVIGTSVWYFLGIGTFWLCGLIFIAIEIILGAFIILARVGILKKLLHVIS